MNREDIIRMAREAKLLPEWVDLCQKDEDALVRFATLVAAAERDRLEGKFRRLEALMQVREQQPNKPCCLAEREACAKVCDAKAADPSAWDYELVMAANCAAAIRARGQA